MSVLEITAIVTAVTAVIGVAAAIFLRQRQATHQASDGGVIAPDNKGVVETRRDTTVHGQGTSADHAQSVSIQHIYGFATEGRDSFRRMEATMDDLRSEVANLVAVVSSKTIKTTKETDDPETLRERAGREFEKGEYEAGRQHSERALVLSQADPDADLQLQLDILVDLVEAATDVHNIWDSLRYHRRAAELAERIAGGERSVAILESRVYERIAAYLRASIAHQMRRLGRPAAAFRELSQAHELAEGAGDLHLEATISDGLGEYYREVGDEPKAIEHLERAADVFSRIGRADSEATSRLSLGDVQANQDNDDLASQAYSKALENARVAGNPGLQAEALIGLAGLQATEDGGSSAEGLLQDALHLAKESGKSILSIRSLNALVTVDMERRNLAKADERLLEGLALAKEADDGASELLLLLRMTTVAVLRGDYERALSHLNRAEVLRKEVPGTDELRVEEWIGRIKEKIRDKAADE